VSDDDGHAPRVLVAIPTYRRPRELDRLLRSLQEQRLEEPYRVEVLTLDNDPAGSAAAPARAADRSGSRSWPVEVRRVEKAGVVAVRNVALEAAACHDALVFVDDDLLLEPDTLEALLRCWIRGDRPAMVVGNVTFVLGDRSPWWSPVVEIVSQQRERTREGDTVESGGLGLSLVDGGFLRTTGLRFDTRFGLTGGEDSRFIREAARLGHPALSCPSARAVDVLEEDRRRARWAAWRCLRVGNTWGLLLLEEGGWSLRSRLVVGGRAAAGLAVALGGAVAAAVRLDGRGCVLHGANLIMRVGRVLACCGLSVREYRGAAVRPWPRNVPSAQRR
jgi:succinoglycan biosynthesis protein ExoM